MSIQLSYLPQYESGYRESHLDTDVESPGDASCDPSPYPWRITAGKSEGQTPICVIQLLVFRKYFVVADYVLSIACHQISLQHDGLQTQNSRHDKKTQQTGGGKRMRFANHVHKTRSHANLFALTSWMTFDDVSRWLSLRTNGIDALYSEGVPTVLHMGLPNAHNKGGQCEMGACEHWKVRIVRYVLESRLHRISGARFRHYAM